MIRTLLLAVASFLALHAQDNPFSDDARQAYGIVKVSVLKAAERMPAADYSFRTTPKVRTFAEMIDHVTQAQMLMCGVVKGEKSITNPQFKPAPTTKADLVAALKASFDYCDPVYASMTDAAGTAKVKWFIGDMSRLGLLNGTSRTTTKCTESLVLFCGLRVWCPHPVKPDHPPRNNDHCVDYRRASQLVRQARAGVATTRRSEGELLWSASEEFIPDELPIRHWNSYEVLGSDSKRLE
jgi:hypothetical protein